MIIGPFTVYAHESTDEECAEYAEDIVDRQELPDGALDHVTAFLDLNPLYEVAFDFILDTDTSTAYCIKVDLGDGEPFTRPYPGQQLKLF